MADTDSEMLIETPKLPPGPMTFEEFTQLVPDDVHAEWVDGYPILLHVTVEERHAKIVSFLTFLFGVASRIGQLGQVYGEPFLMHLPALRRGRAPDLFFVRAEHRSVVRRHNVEGPADVVVEVVSPGSRRLDRVTKLDEYERAGVPEYWLIEPELERAIVRVLGSDGRYTIAFDGSEGEFQSTQLPSLRLRFEWLWQQPGPDMDEVLRLLGR